MGLDTLLRGFRRGDTSVEQRIEATKRGAMLVQKDLPDWAELCDAGCMWSVMAATAVAGVIGSAYPTTAALISLYNNEPEGGKTYFLHSVFGIQIANAAALNTWGLIHMVNVAKPTTRPTADIAVASIKGRKALQGSYGGNAIVDLAATITDDLFKPVGMPTYPGGLALAGTQIEVMLDGSVVLPPGGMYNLSAIASAVDITVRLGFCWAEVQR